MRRGGRDQPTDEAERRLIPKPATPKLKASVQDARLMLGRGLHRLSLQFLMRVLAQELQLLVLTFASLRGQCLKETVVFCGVAESCVDAICEQVPLERTLNFVRSFVMRVRNRNISKSFRCRLVLNPVPQPAVQSGADSSRRTRSSGQRVAVSLLESANPDLGVHAVGTEPAMPKD
jgi:hypothetical protein